MTAPQEPPKPDYFILKEIVELKLFNNRERLLLERAIWLESERERDRAKIKELESERNRVPVWDCLCGQRDAEIKSAQAILSIDEENLRVSRQLLAVLVSMAQSAWSSWRKAEKYRAEILKIRDMDTADSQANARLRDENAALTSRLHAIDRLLACYRLQRRPTLELWAALDQTRQRLEKIAAAKEATK